MEVLALMSDEDRIRKYLPKLSSGEINREQYDLVRRFRRNKKVSQTVSQEEFIQSFTGVATADVETNDRRDISSSLRETSAVAIFNATNHPSKETGNSQKALVYELLSDGRPHDTVEIMDYAYKIREEKAGNCNIKARIDDLRKEGWIIPTAHHIKGGVYAYVIIGKQDEPYYIKDDKQHQEKINQVFRKENQFETIGKNLLSG